MVLLRIQVCAGTVETGSTPPQESIDVRAEWPSGLCSLRQVTEVKLGRVRSNSGWVTTDA